MKWLCAFAGNMNSYISRIDPTPVIGDPMHVALINQDGHVANNYFRHFLDTFVVVGLQDVIACLSSCKSNVRQKFLTASSLGTPTAVTLYDWGQVRRCGAGVRRFAVGAGRVVVSMVRQVEQQGSGASWLFRVHGRAL